MIADTNDPYVAELLRDWFENRERLFALRSGDDVPSFEEQCQIDTLCSELVEIGDELVAVLVPSALDRENL